MKFSDYMKDNQITLLVCFAGGLFFSVLLLAFGISLSEMALLWVCFAIIVFLQCSHIFGNSKNGFNT